MKTKIEEIVGTLMASEWRLDFRAACAQAAGIGAKCTAEQIAEIRAAERSIIESRAIAAHFQRLVRVGQPRTVLGAAEVRTTLTYGRAATGGELIVRCQLEIDRLAERQGGATGEVLARITSRRDALIARLATLQPAAQLAA